MECQTITATYHLTCAENEVKPLSRDIALEQTVEVPEVLVTSDHIREKVVAKVASIEPAGAGRFAVILKYNAALASSQLPQLLNLLYGNISIKNNIRLMDVTLPTKLLKVFRGPNFGIAGVRALLGVYDRPLLATALKPRGSSDRQLAEIARQFALGGGEIIKDDHNLVDDSFAAFQRRATLCQSAVAEANAKTGRNCLYFANISAPAGVLERFVEFVVRKGIRGILISPLLVGLDSVRHIAERYPIVVMSHPTFAGTFFHDKRHGIEPGVLLGTLFRLAGTDISVFPNFGGRFCFTQEECASIAQRLCSPLGQLKAGLPAPAGGMKFDNIPFMVRQYGSDAVFLCGGALLSHSRSLRDSTAALLSRVREHFRERLVEPQRELSSACELPSNAAGAVIEHLPHQPNFTWKGRKATPYKSSDKLPFQNVTRHELLGPFGEKAAFDLRYFEIAPGGFSSLEKHVHTHAIIAARGRGVLVIDGQRFELKPLDIAHVPPLKVHQLRNETKESFGFFCIVDHERDRPMAP